MTLSFAKVHVENVSFLPEDSLMIDRATQRHHQQPQREPACNLQETEHHAEIIMMKQLVQEASATVERDPSD